MQACPPDWVHVGGTLRPHAFARGACSINIYCMHCTIFMSPVYLPSAMMMLYIHVSWRHPGCHDIVFLGKNVDTWTLYIMSAWPQKCCQSALCCFCRYVKCSNALHIVRDLTELQAEVDAFELHR